MFPQKVVEWGLGENLWRWWLQREVFKRGFGGTGVPKTLGSVLHTFQRGGGGGLGLRALMRFRCEKAGISPVPESGAPSGDKVPAPRKGTAASPSASFNTTTGRIL